MRKLIRLIFTGEFLFALFLLSGAFKEVFTWLPIDLTAVTLVLTALIVVKRVYIHREINKKASYVLGLYLFFITLIIFSLIFTDSTTYFIDKTFRFIFITSWAFIVPFFLLNNKESLKKFMHALAIIATLSSIAVLYNFFNNTNVNTNFVSIGDGNYLGTARLIGTGSIALLIIYLYKFDMSRRLKFMTLACLVFSVFALLLTGARMPLIAFTITFLSLLLFSVTIKNKKVYVRNGVKRILFIIILIVPSFFLLRNSEFTQTFINRVTVLFKDGLGASGVGRVNRYDTAIEMIKANPFFGQGFGSFGINHEGRDGREYAHNIFLEVGSELGLIGLILITLIIAISLIRSALNTKNGGYLNVWIFASLIYLLANAMVSGDLNDNRMLFALIGIAAHSSLYNSKTIQFTSENTNDVYVDV